MPPVQDVGPVLITGCSSGLGHAAARAFRASGHTTIATARDPADIEDLKAIGCEILELDVRDEANRRETVEAVEGRYGRIGVLINNAGIGQYGPIEEIPLDAIRNTFETNVFGHIGLIQLALPAMRRAGRGRIINVSSVAGRATTQGGGVYHMTKYALESLADAIRPEVKPFGIDVVNILPGPFVSAYRDKILASIPDTGPDSPYATFKRNLWKWMYNHIAPGAFGVLSAEDVARVVVRAATAPRPRTRYSVGFIARTGPAGRSLSPDRFVDMVMSRQMPHDRPK